MKLFLGNVGVPFLPKQTTCAVVFEAASYPCHAASEENLHTCCVITPPTPHPRPPSPALSPAPESCHAGTLCRREPLSTKHQMCILLVVDVYGQPVAEPSVRLIFVASRSHCESNLLSDLVFEDLAFKYYRKASITK